MLLRERKIKQKIVVPGIEAVRHSSDRSELRDTMANHQCCSVTDDTFNYACLLPAKVGTSIHDTFPATHQLTSECQVSA